MDDVIDVLIAIDAESIIKKYGTNTDSDMPTYISSDNELIYMTTRKDHIDGSPGSELKIKASPGDVIRWRETTMSLNAHFTSILYKFDASSGASLIKKPEPVTVNANEPLPNAENPLKPGTQKISVFFWECTVLQSGSVTYHFSFMILDNSGQIQGYYYWDPFINIQG
jgi:hypothetical protein